LLATKWDRERVAFVDCQLLAKGRIFQGNLLVTTEGENQESNRYQKSVQHAAMTVRPSDGRINKSIAYGRRSSMRNDRALFTTL
jgi:hypothetical protein